MRVWTEGLSLLGAVGIMREREPRDSSRNSCFNRRAGDTKEVLHHVRL